MSSDPVTRMSDHIDLCRQVRTYAAIADEPQSWWEAWTAPVDRPPWRTCWIAASSSSRPTPFGPHYAPSCRRRDYGCHDRIVEMPDVRRKAVNTEMDELCAKRNSLSKQICPLMREGNREAAEPPKAEVKAFGDRLHWKTKPQGARDRAARPDDVDPQRPR